MVAKKKFLTKSAPGLSPSMRFRNEWLAKGYDLVDVTPLLDFRLGNSGWCNAFSEPDENIYHVKVFYRGECIGSLPDLVNIDEQYTVFFTNEDDVSGSDFVVYRLVPLKRSKK